MNRCNSISNNEEFSSNSDENDSLENENEEYMKEETSYEEDLLNIPLPPGTSEDDLNQEQPIKISIYSSKDGKYRLKYDDYAAEEEEEADAYFSSSAEEEEDENTNFAFTNKKKYCKKSVKASKLSKSTTETLYEIDLFCEVCNHDYKSLMSLNRHKRTRKHLNQVAKLNETGNRPAKSVERDWNNYESYLSTYELMPREVYNSIVQTLLEDSDNKVSDNHKLEANNLRTHFSRRRDRIISGDGLHRTQNNIYNFNEFSDTSRAYHSFPNYGMNANGFVSTVQPEYGQYSPFKCPICYEFFPTLYSLESHIEQMSSHCSNILNSTNTEINIDESFI